MNMPVQSPPPSERSQKILAKTIYRKLQETGLSGQELIAVATALLGLIAEDIRTAG